MSEESNKKGYLANNKKKMKSGLLSSIRKKDKDKDKDKERPSSSGSNTPPRKK
jgi:hypothetical protein